MHVVAGSSLILSIWRRRRSKGVQRVSLLKALLLNFNTFLLALAFFHLFFGLSFSGILESSLCSFFDLLPLLLFSSLNCFLQSSLSFLHTAPIQRSELVMRAANSLLWNYCKSCAGNWYLSQFYCEEGEEWKEIKWKLQEKKNDEERSKWKEGLLKFQRPSWQPGQDLLGYWKFTLEIMSFQSLHLVILYLLNNLFEVVCSFWKLSVVF